KIRESYLRNFRAMFSEGRTAAACHGNLGKFSSVLSVLQLSQAIDEGFIQRYLGSSISRPKSRSLRFLVRYDLCFPHNAVDRSVVVVAFIGFVIAAQIDADEPSMVASCNDLTNFASHRVSSLARNRGTQLAHACDINSADIQIH